MGERGGQVGERECGGGGGGGWRDIRELGLSWGQVEREKERQRQRDRERDT